MFNEKRILVTGGSRGIGWAAAKAFLDAGARVAVNGRTGESTAAGIERLGGGERLVAAPGDIASVAGCEAMVKAAVDALGGLDVLVNSAGIGMGRSIEEGDEAFYDLKAPLKMPSGALNRLESGRRDTGIRGTSDGPNGLF